MVDDKKVRLLTGAVSLVELQQLISSLGTAAAKIASSALAVSTFHSPVLMCLV